MKKTLTLNLAVVVLEIIGFALSLGKNGQSFVRFYTEDSNLLALAACAVTAVFAVRAISGHGAAPEWVRIFKYIALCCTTLTFVVVVLILGPMTGSVRGYLFFLFGSSMLYHHFLCPVLMFVSFVFFEKGPALQKKHIGAALVPTAIYAAVILTLNIAGSITGPYPFLRVYDQPLWMSCMWVAVIFGAACLIAACVRVVYNRVSR